jgi:hypothetical protein
MCSAICLTAGVLYGYKQSPSSTPALSDNEKPSAKRSHDAIIGEGFNPQTRSNQVLQPREELIGAF